MIGIDMIEQSRMAETIGRSGDIFLRRVFSDSEIHRARLRDNPTRHFASAFAAKEAVFKALNLGWDQEVDFREMEILRGRSGEPLVRLQGNIKIRADEKDCRRVHLSISYETDLAIAMAFAEG